MEVFAYLSTCNKHTITKFYNCIQHSNAIIIMPVMHVQLFFFSDISHKSTEIEFLKYILLINSIQSEVNKNIAIDIY